MKDINRKELDIRNSSSSCVGESVDGKTCSEKKVKNNEEKHDTQQSHQAHNTHKNQEQSRAERGKIEHRQAQSKHDLCDDKSTENRPPPKPLVRPGPTEFL